MQNWLEMYKATSSCNLCILCLFVHLKEERWLNGSASVNTYRLAARDCDRDFSGCRAHRDLVFRPVVRESAGLGAVPVSCSCLAPDAQAEAFSACVYSVHFC
jgi:hypothetical protein